MVVRPAVSEDQSSIIDLLASMDPTTQVYDPDYTPITIRRLLETDDRYGYVAEDKGMIIGCVFITEDLLFCIDLGGLRSVGIASLAVAEDYRGQETGPKLVQTILAHHFHHREIRQAWAMVVATNERSRKCFEHFAQATPLGNRFWFSWQLKDQPWLKEAEP